MFICCLLLLTWWGRCVFAVYFYSPSGADVDQQYKERENKELDGHRSLPAYTLNDQKRQKQAYIFNKHIQVHSITQLI